MSIDDELEGYTGSSFCKSCQHLYETCQAAMLESSCNHHFYTHVYTVPGTGDVVKGSRQECRQQQACSASGVW